ncbi:MULTISPECIES: regulatory protein RecX [Tatumella]|uniref:Regulatory protein RecX n=2 Tax=Tatumella ptyseos TaxID=82987 RepID=A0A085JAG1_9GAMM|nr:MULTISPECIES: regulatory protein RecX [Tatumella]KFD17457.1 RecX family regulatory protein [Tatumella ptyseos ATCC 33301]SQK72894.1 Regulatory protein recX [Tatumella ptyseos]
MLFTENERRPSFTALLDRAMRLLAQRDHPEQELREKIHLSLRRSELRQGSAEPLDEEALEQVIAYCHENGWLNDDSFTERFIVSRSRSGYGPQRIRQDLTQKGVDRHVIERAMSEADVDWLACASDVAQKKYGDQGPACLKEKAKAQRFLYSRGFLMADIRAVLANFGH